MYNKFFRRTFYNLTVPYEKKNLNFCVGGMHNFGMENKSGPSLNICSSMYVMFLLKPLRPTNSTVMITLHVIDKRGMWPTVGGCKW